MLVLGYLLAALIGLSLGLMGGGGSILTVPIFVYVLGFGAKQAIAMSFPVVGGTSAIGAIGHWRSGNVDLRAAAMFGGVAMAGSFAGGQISTFLAGSTQLVLLALAMLGAAWSMARSRRAEPEDCRDVKLRLGPLLAVGFVVGMLTGIVGIGGGFLYVPALVVLAREPMKRAIGTSLVVIAMTCVTGLLSHMRREVIPWAFVAGFTAVAIVGIVVGTRLVKLVSAVQLRRAFAGFLVVLAALILFQNGGRFASRTASAAPAAPPATVGAGGPPH